MLLSLFTDFENFAQFKSDPRHVESLRSMLDQLIAWWRVEDAAAVKGPERFFVGGLFKSTLPARGGRPLLRGGGAKTVAIASLPAWAG